MSVPDPQSVDELTRRFRRRLLNRDRLALREIVREYRASRKRILAEIDSLEARLLAAAPDELRPSWLLQRDRLLSVERQIRSAIAGYAPRAAEAVAAAQADVVGYASDDALALSRAALGSPPPGAALTWNPLPEEAMQSFVGRASNGSALRELFDALGPQLSRHARSTLLTGLATGRGPAVIARQLRDNVGLTMVRAMRISRTETLTAYRRASSEIYRANSDVVVDKLWWASLVGSCASCFELHGSSIGLDGEVYDHPNGACTSVPVTKSWAELGYGEGGDERFSTKPGAEKFAELSADQQRRQLGPGKYAAMQNGEIELRDLVKRTHDPRWGPMYREATLTEARDAAAQRATSEVA